MNIKTNAKSKIIDFELMFIVKDMGLISFPNLDFEYKIDILHNKTESSMLAFSKFLLIRQNVLTCQPKTTWVKLGF